MLTNSQRLDWREESPQAKKCLMVAKMTPHDFVMGGGSGKGGESVRLVIERSRGRFPAEAAGKLSSLD